jgi:hypothetical protein
MSQDQQPKPPWLTPCCRRTRRAGRVLTNSRAALTITFICHYVVSIVARLSTMCEKFKRVDKVLRFSSMALMASCERAR